MTSHEWQPRHETAPARSACAGAAVAVVEEVVRQTGKPVTIITLGPLDCRTLKFALMSSEVDPVTIRAMRGGVGGMRREELDIA